MLMTLYFQNGGPAGLTPLPSSQRKTSPLSGGPTWFNCSIGTATLMAAYEATGRSKIRFFSHPLDRVDQSWSVAGNHRRRGYVVCQCFGLLAARARGAEGRALSSAPLVCRRVRTSGIRCSQRSDLPRRGRCSRRIWPVTKWTDRCSRAAVIIFAAAGDRLISRAWRARTRAAAGCCQPAKACMDYYRSADGRNTRQRMFDRDSGTSMPRTSA